jgi:neutral ceramidase
MVENGGCVGQLTDRVDGNRLTAGVYYPQSPDKVSELYIEAFNVGPDYLKRNIPRPANQDLNRAQTIERYRPMKLHCILVLPFLLSLVPCCAAADDVFPVKSNLSAAAAKVDITPAPDTKVVGHVRETHGIRDPLRAGILLLRNEQTAVALVTLDLIGAWEEMVAALRDEIARQTAIPRENILITASHNHSGPGWAKDSTWSQQMVASIGAAAAAAEKELRPVTIGYGEDRIDFNINRRQVINGRCDHRVKVLRFDDGRSLEPVAAIMHAVCHPCVFTWGDKLTPPYPQGFPKISADFPGVAQTFVEQAFPERTKTLFLQGCAGDIRPNLPGFPYRCGDEADIHWTGRNLGCAVVRALDRTAVREEAAKRKSIYPLKLATTVALVPGKKDKVRCELAALRVGDFLFLMMPGEPMVEYGFQLERAIADRAVPIVVGYANGNVGYICTAQAHEEGGYEPNASPLSADAETILLDELGRLADRVLADVFESFAPPRPAKK